MSRTIKIILGIVVVAGVIVFSSAAFVVDKTEQVVITQFGDPVGESITEPGLYFKLPFVQTAHSFDKRFLEWNGDANEIPTKDKRFIEVDTYARWRITNPLTFYQRLHDERRAQSRLDDIIDGATRDAVANNDLLEIVRASNRKPTVDPDIKDSDRTSLADIDVGRPKIMKSIEKSVAGNTADLGIEVIDVRFKRINYNDTVRKKVYDRMIAERKRIAERYRSEGKGEAATIRGKKEKELDEIRSEAEKKAQQTRGKADGKVTKIYADSYTQDADFYEFLRTMETYPDVLDKESWLMMSTDSQFFKYLKQYRETETP